MNYPAGGQGVATVKCRSLCLHSHNRSLVGNTTNLYSIRSGPLGLAHNTIIFRTKCNGLQILQIFPLDYWYFLLPASLDNITALKFLQKDNRQIRVDFQYILEISRRDNARSDEGLMQNFSSQIFERWKFDPYQLV